MKCDEFESRLNAVLDERRHGEFDVELSQHRAACPRCHDLASAYDVLLNGFYTLKTPELPADFAQRVLAEMQVRPAPTRRFALASAALATAAAVAIAAYLPWRTSSESAAPQIAAAPKTAVAVPQAQVAAHARPFDAAPADINWEELGDIPLVGPVLTSMSDKDQKTDPYAAIARGTGQGLASVVLSMPGLGRPSNSWEISDELRPVTESMTETFNLLIRSFPLTPASPAPNRKS